MPKQQIANTQNVRRSFPSPLALHLRFAFDMASTMNPRIGVPPIPPDSLLGGNEVVWKLPIETKLVIFIEKASDVFKDVNDALQGNETDAMNIYTRCVRPTVVIGEFMDEANHLIDALAGRVVQVEDEDRNEDSQKLRLESDLWSFIETAPEVAKKVKDALEGNETEEMIINIYEPPDSDDEDCNGPDSHPLKPTALLAQFIHEATDLKKALEGKRINV